MKIICNVYCKKVHFTAILIKRGGVKMAFWDNLSQKASETTAKAMQKAKEISDVAKLNSMISEEETKINNTYNQIGKLYVSMHSRQCEDEFTGLISAVLDSEEKIRNYRQQIQDIKGVIHCLQCGAEVQSGVAFCGSCGAPIPKVQQEDTDNLVKCESCNAMVKKGIRFCTVCGKPMGQVEVSEMDNTPVDEHETTENICPNCGVKIQEDLAFCTECGTKF